MTREDAVLRVGDQEYRLPVIVGAEGEVAVDINSLRGTSGMVAFDRGFANTAETKSAITFLDGEKGILRYRGYPIEQIAEHASFLEVVIPPLQRRPSHPGSTRRIRRRDHSSHDAARRHEAPLRGLS